MRKTDRRVERTKKLLWDALVRLILEKGYESLTIQDIIDEANVGRSTFYSHYESKEQLLFSGQPQWMEVLFHPEDKGGPIDFEAIFLHVEENKEVAKALLGKKSGNLLLKHMQEVIRLKLNEIYKNANAEMHPADLLRKKFMIEAASAALVSILSNWIEQDMPLGIEQMNEMCSVLIGNMLETPNG